MHQSAPRDQRELHGDRPEGSDRLRSRPFAVGLLGRRDPASGAGPAGAVVAAGPLAGSAQEVSGRSRASTARSTASAVVPPP